MKTELKNKLSLPLSVDTVCVCVYTYVYIYSIYRQYRHNAQFAVATSLGSLPKGVNPAIKKTMQKKRSHLHLKIKNFFFSKFVCICNKLSM